MECIQQKLANSIVHSCTIFLCFLDGEIQYSVATPYMRLFFLHRALEAILDQNECVFLKKTNVQGVNPRKKINFGEKNHFLWPGEAVFCDLWSFPKNKDRSPKIRINLPTLTSAHQKGLARYKDRSLFLRIDPYF